MKATTTTTIHAWLALAALTMIAGVMIAGGMIAVYTVLAPVNAPYHAAIMGK